MQKSTRACNGYKTRIWIIWKASTPHSFFFCSHKTIANYTSIVKSRTYVSIPFSKGLYNQNNIKLVQEKKEENYVGVAICIEEKDQVPDRKKIKGRNTVLLEFHFPFLVSAYNRRVYTNKVCWVDPCVCFFFIPFFFLHSFKAKVRPSFASSLVPGQHFTDRATTVADIHTHSPDDLTIIIIIFENSLSK